jgi:hypothetical protein
VRQTSLLTDPSAVTKLLFQVSTIAIACVAAGITWPPALQALGISSIGAVARNFDRALKDQSAGNVGVVQYHKETRDWSDAQGRALLKHKWYCQQVYAQLEDDTLFDAL